MLLTTPPLWLHSIGNDLHHVLTQTTSHIGNLVKMSKEAGLTRRRPRCCHHFVATPISLM